MKLSIIIPVLNRHEVTLESLFLLNKNSITYPDVYILDNGSDQEFESKIEYTNIHLHIINKKEISGVWSTFQQGLNASDADILAYLHNDLFITENGWDQRIIQEFEKDELLGLIGFVGSYEQGRDGGRGSGTMSNFQDNTYSIGRGSPAEAHGKRITGLRASFIEDGCSMIFKRDAISKALIGYDNFPPHHFYDRLLSLRMAQLNFRTATIGIACDHISGQTANTQQKWKDYARSWCEQHTVSVVNGDEDHSVYLESERRFLKLLHEYMGDAQIIVVNEDYTKSFRSY